jgi:Icc-related predicted phosphoesterase
MKLVLISDTHNQHKHLTSKGIGNTLPEGDLLVHAGDLTGLGRREELHDVFTWFKEVASRYTHGVVFIAGNHDRSFDPKFNLESDTEKPSWLRDMLFDIKANNYGVEYLENSGIEINGVKIWGSPITPWFYGDHWGFNKHRGSPINDIWNQIPLDTDVLITHGPPLGYGDFTINDRTHVGCEDLRYRIKEVKPKVHVFGHIHEGYDMIEEEHTTYINASICDENYDPINKPVIIKI